MIKVSKFVMLHIFVRLMVILAFTKVISLSVLWYLPSDGVELDVKTSKQPKYQRVDFKNMIKDVTKVTTSSQESMKKTVNISITSMVLKGFYGLGSKGYAIVALKTKPKDTSIVSIGEIFSSYTLKLIKSNGVVFTKNNKDYVLNLEKPKNNSSIQAVKQEYKADESTKQISRKDIKHYSKNPKQMWKDISLVDHKVNKKLMGFRITKVNRDSKFATLGLKAQDIIVKVNNVALTSYKEVFDVYNKIDKLDTVQIIVLRKNEEKEFIYEIN